MGSIFSPKTNTPPPPPAPPPVTIRDEIGGVEQVPVTQPDGSTTYITRRIPLTAEQEAEQAEYDAILSGALTEIQKLSSAGYEIDDQTKNILDDWESERLRLTKKSLGNRGQQEEAILARRGLSDSSAAEAVRRQRRLDEQDTLVQIDRERDALAESVRAERLGLQQNLYNIAAGRNNLEATKALQAASGSLSTAIGANQARQASILDYYNRNTTYQPSVFGQLAPAIGAAAGFAVGGPAGASAGYSLGTMYQQSETPQRR